MHPTPNFDAYQHLRSFGSIVAGVYTPVLAKHSKNFSLEDRLAIGVDRMQRNFGPLKQEVEEWQAQKLSAASAKPLISRRSSRTNWIGVSEALGAARARVVLSACARGVSPAGLVCLRAVPLLIARILDSVH
jgi:hypothetical protein